MSTYEGGTVKPPVKEYDGSHDGFFQATDAVMDFSLKTWASLGKASEDYAKSAELVKNAGLTIPTTRKEYSVLLDKAHDLADEILKQTNANSELLVSLLSKSVV